MHFAWGMSRFVIVLPNVVIKFAYFNPLTFLKNGIGYLWRGDVDSRVEQYRFKDTSGLMRFLPSRLIVNWQEYMFYQETCASYLAPTLWSFYGLINIQRRGRVVRGDEEVWEQYVKALHSQEFLPTYINGVYITDINHAPNLCFIDGNLVIHDYGDWKVQKQLLDGVGRILNQINKYQSFKREAKPEPVQS